MRAATADRCRAQLDRGLIPAVPVPFGVSGEISAEAQKRYVAHMAQQPVAGVAVWAHTGRGLRLTREQRLEVLGVWREGLSEQKIVIAGVGGLPSHAGDSRAFIDSAVDMARDAFDTGADALLVYPPSALRRLPEGEALVLEYHRQLASAGPQILFYLYEAAGGLAYSAARLREVLAHPNVFGIKLATLDSVMTFQDIAGLLAAEFPEKLLVTGEDRFLGYSLMCGARAALVGMGAVCTVLQHDLLQSHFDRNAARFLELSQAVDRLGQVLFVAPMEGYIRRTLWALACLGIFEAEAAHDPWGPGLADSEFRAIANLLEELGQVVG